MITIIVTNEFVQLNEHYCSFGHMLKRPLNFIIQKGDLGFQLNYISRLRIFLVLSVVRLRRTLRLSIGFIVL